MHSKFLEYLVEELGPEFNPSDKPDKRASLTLTYHAGDARVAITIEMKTDTIATENLLGIFARGLGYPMRLLNEESGTGFEAACDRAFDRVDAYLKGAEKDGGDDA